MVSLFRDLRISRKLAVIFMPLLFMMGAGGSIGLYSAYRISNATEQLYTDSFRRIETLSSIEKEFFSQRQELFLYAITNEEGTRSFLGGSIEEHKRNVSKLLKDYSSLGVYGEKEINFEEMKFNFLHYWSIQSRIMVLALKGDRQTSLNLIRGTGDKVFSQGMNFLREVLKEELVASNNIYLESRRAAQTAIVATIAFTFLALVTALWLWYVLTKALVSPILSISESAKHIGEGDLTGRADVYNKDEIGNLAIEFNKMAANLEEYYGTLENKVEERTKELSRAYEEIFEKKHELEVSNRELQEASRMKSQFLANVSHELRTPLNSIIGFSDLLQEKAFGVLNEKQLQYVDYISTSGTHLLHLINNILDLSKIEAGRMELNKELFSITDVVGEVLGTIRPMAHHQGVTIDVKEVQAPPRLYADRTKVKQILMNVLSNAVKFNDDNGKVFLDWEVVDEGVGMKMERMLILKVRDTGIGIKNEDIDKLFSEFQQLDSSYTREYEGTGLGLVLTKRLVELHDGNMWVTSEYGEGSTFYIKIPQGSNEIDIPQPRPIVVEDADISGGEERKIVICTESSDLNHLIGIFLAAEPYEAVILEDCLTILERAAEIKADVIIMGVALPSKDGWEILKELKEDERTAEIPVIILSSTDNRELGTSLGVSVFIEKPMDKIKLLSGIHQALGLYNVSEGGEGEGGIDNRGSGG